MTDTRDAAPAVGAPVAFAGLREFSYDARGPWFDDPGSERPVDLAEELHLASRISAAFPAQALGPAGRQLTVRPELGFELGRKALSAAGPRLPLPSPTSVPVDLTEVVQGRRSALPADCAVVGWAELGTVLGLSFGPSPGRPGLRVTPSGGALYPLDVVVIAHQVGGLDPGAYLYDAVEHCLRPRGRVDPREFHTRATAPLFRSPQDAPPQPAATLAVVASFTRSRAKYGLRGYRFALLEAGHLVQAAIIAATALGLASQPWGGFIDDAVDEQLELDGLERSCVYLLALADPARPSGSGHA